MIDLTPIINAVIALAAALIAYYVIPWLRRHTTEKEREELLRLLAVVRENLERMNRETEEGGN